ncbi:ectoine/hydroxyectoine ABC transporter permease subunit EhuC [Brooklawnia cerclae]|uniref:amino acid ABC transporter permease n=1 Tax=Brooklawnia cerclae TaxID=349934 RepID=UPI0031D7A81E
MDRVLPYFPYILKGFGMTVLIAVLAIIGDVVIGALLTAMRRSRFRVPRGIALVFVEVSRGTSEVVQLFWVFFALPVLLRLQLPPLVAAVAVLSINGGAYASEVMRGSLNAVPKVQYEACVALGFSRFTAMRRVIGPQAIRIMLPSLANVATNTAKTTSVVSLVTIADLAFAVQTVRINTGESVVAYLIALGLYLALTSTIMFLFERGEHRMQWETMKPRRRKAVTA